MAPIPQLQAKKVVPHLNHKVSQTVIFNVNIFDSENGGTFTGSVLFGGKMIKQVKRGLNGFKAEDIKDVELVDGQGGWLLPGFVDAHLHFLCVHDLVLLQQYGVTTAYDLETWPPELLNSLRNQPGLTDIRSAILAAYKNKPGFPPEGVVNNPGEANHWVLQRVVEGSDFIKIVTNEEPPLGPGIDLDTVSALASSAASVGKLSIIHATTTKSFKMGQAAKCKVFTHSPIDGRLDDTLVQQMISDGSICIPTLIMMKETAIATTELANPMVVNALVTAGAMTQEEAKNVGGLSPERSEDLRAEAATHEYNLACENVMALYKAGVPILAGTDANRARGAPGHPSHGDSLHDEMLFLHRAGMPIEDVLKAATINGAKHFGLDDRGVIKEGMRADLVLLTPTPNGANPARSDPTKNIAATRNISNVWCAGETYPPKEGKCTHGFLSLRHRGC